MGALAAALDPRPPAGGSRRRPVDAGASSGRADDDRDCRGGGASRLRADGRAIAGLVKDASGGVLPGVTVEAASPALIEGMRTAVTDGNGQYKIVDLRPGEYTVTFTLTGFRPFKREGISLPASFTATVNADLSVGLVQEALTVTGESPLVDVQGSVSQKNMNREMLDTIPTGKDPFAVMSRYDSTTSRSISVLAVEARHYTQGAAGPRRRRPDPDDHLTAAP
jgi:hypothetical protein